MAVLSSLTSSLAVEAAASPPPSSGLTHSASRMNSTSITLPWIINNQPPSKDPSLPQVSVLHSPILPISKPIFKISFFLAPTPNFLINFVNNHFFFFFPHHTDYHTIFKNMVLNCDYCNCKKLQKNTAEAIADTIKIAVLWRQWWLWTSLEPC